MLFEVTAEPLDAQRLVDHVRRAEAGAIALFYGVVRNENLGRRVLYLKYDAYPEMATKVMRQIADDVRQRFSLTDIAISSAHRGVAFEACRYVIDTLKVVVPIWKKEVWEGGEEWIEGEAPAGGKTP